MAAHGSLPHHVTAYVGSDNAADCCLYALWKDGQMLVIQATSCIPPEYTHFGADRSVDDKLLREFNFGIEKITTLLNVLDFGRSNWAYLLTRKDGSYGLVYKNKPVYRISCNTWAPFVDERDIIFTKWITCEDRHGLWRGKEVDVFIGWNDAWAKVVERETEGHRLMQGLDVTFDVLGHVIRGDQVVGIMTAPANGRMVEYGDRAAVYDAITKIQSKGLLYTGISAANIMIVDGKVRFLCLTSVRTFHPDAEGLQKADLCHWERLKNLFDDELKHQVNWMPPLRSLSQRIKILPRIPYPQRPLVDDFSDSLFRVTIYYRDLFLDSRGGSKKATSVQRRSKHSRTHGSQVRAVTLAEVSGAESRGVDEVKGTRDLSLNLMLPHPYLRRHDSSLQRRRYYTSRPLLLMSNSSDTTSDSGGSPMS